MSSETVTKLSKARSEMSRPELYAMIDSLQETIAATAQAIRSGSLVRSKPVASGVEVKPLEWKQHTEGVWRAETLIGDYRVWTHHEADGKWFWNLSGGTVTRSDRCASEGSGKAAAEADYRNRILSALLPKATAPVVSEPVATMHRATDHDETLFSKGWHGKGLMGFISSPLYASPQIQPKAVTEEMVERLFQAVMPFTVGTAFRELRAALEAAMKEA